MTKNHLENIPSNSISDVERETGLAKETLRVWERRYGFPQPLRDALGERVYPADQVQRLRMVKRLIDLGHRPGKVINCSQSQLQELTEVSGAGRSKAQTATSQPPARLQEYLDLCGAGRVEDLRRKLSQDLMQLGMLDFVIGLVAPLNVAVGESWATGRFAVHEEHLYTESLQMVMRSAISALPQTTGPAQCAPRILLTTFPQERHGLGILMAEAIFAVQGAQCTSLGVQTPIGDIVEAAKAHQADVVALSFSSAMNPRQAGDGLKELRQRLPPDCQIWAGGHCPALARRPPKDIRILMLSEIAAAIAEWRRAKALAFTAPS